MGHSAIALDSSGLLSEPVLLSRWVTLYAWAPDAGTSVELRFPIRDMERGKQVHGPEPDIYRLRRLSREVVPAARIFLDRVLRQGESWQSLAAESPITLRLPH
ncbi:MAG: hypothetical protein JJU06_13615 [Ectothiorhodospiraceae bacterium]|nr:hypothetical protein [Ectothiorhodospiraceae bacterium]MCH8505198.1 hypothetical protein [Ectothiorhodospiraceae bacterium]